MPNLRPWEHDPIRLGQCASEVLRRVSDTDRTVRYVRYMSYLDAHRAKRDVVEYGPIFQATAQEWERAKP